MKVEIGLAFLLFQVKTKLVVAAEPGTNRLSVPVINLYG